MQIHQSFIKATQKKVFSMVTNRSSAPVLGVSLGYGWLPHRAGGYWKVTYATKAGVMLDLGQTLSLAVQRRMKPPHTPQGNGVKEVGICSILLPFFGLAESPLQKQNALTALPKIGIWPSWGVQEPGAAVQYSTASWEWELKITRWLMILRAIVKLSSCDINQNTNISAVQGRKSPWRCTLGICCYWVARHALGVGNFSCESYPFGQPARRYNGDWIQWALGGVIFPL